MNLKSRTTQRWDFRPLAPVVTIAAGTSTSGSLVPGSQDYCPDIDVYSPDYTLAPLVLQPTVAVFCGDAGMSTSNANHLIHDIEWREVTTDGTFPIVTSTTPSAGQICGAGREEDNGEPIDPYDATGCAQGSSTSGRLIVKRNFPPGKGATLLFTATLTDSRTGENHPLRASFPIATIASWAAPVLRVDVPSVTSYNPIRNRRDQTIQASLMLGGKECPSANRIFVWEVWTGTTWRTYGTDILDYWMDINDDTSTAIVNREMMGERQTIRVRVKYDRNGNPSAASTSDMLSREFSIERVLRELNLQTAISGQIVHGMNGVGARALLSDNQGQIPTDVIDKYFNVIWKTASNSANLNTPSFTKRAYGADTIIPTTSMTSSYGMLTECEVEDKGPLVPLSDGTGTILTDGSDAIFIV